MEYWCLKTQTVQRVDYGVLYNMFYEHDCNFSTRGVF